MKYIDVTTQAQLDKALSSGKQGDIIVCRGSGYFTAYDSAQVRAYDSAQVTAYDSAQVTAYGSAQVRASKYVAVTAQRNDWNNPKIVGGVLIEIPEITTAAEWCDFHGVEVKHGIATLYKAVDDDYSTDYARRAGIAYTPGSKPEAPDWQNTAGCGNGLHVSPRPVMALHYNRSATRYVACPVKVSDMVLIDNKAKVPRIARPVYEVDIDGEAIA